MFNYDLKFFFDIGIQPFGFIIPITLFQHFQGTKLFERGPPQLEHLKNGRQSYENIFVQVRKFPCRTYELTRMSK